MTRSGRYKLTGLLRLGLAIWIALVIAVSIVPLSFKLRLHTIGRWHNFGHYSVYALTGIFLWVVAGRWMLRFFAFVFGMMLAVGQEWVENRLFHAGFESRDVVIDLAGLVTGFALMLLITSLMADGRQGEGSI